LEAEALVSSLDLRRKQFAAEGMLIMSRVEEQKDTGSEPERRVEGVTSIRVGKEKDLRIIPGNRGKVRRNGCVRPLRNK
jgi:hypothetical protein